MAVGAKDVAEGFGADGYAGDEEAVDGEGGEGEGREAGAGGVDVGQDGEEGDFLRDPATCLVFSMIIAESYSPRDWYT